MSTLEPCIEYRGDRLAVDGVPLERIAKDVGTPAYVYSAEEIQQRFAALDAAFSFRDHLICYAMKANPSLSICRLLAKLGAGADVVSGGEFRRAVEAGIDPRKVVFSGVGKTDDEIAYALRKRALALNVESQEELDAVARVAGRLGVTARFTVRLNPNVDAGTHRHITTGRHDNKFGIDFRGALELYGRAQKDRRVKAVGIQSHIGSQITQVKPYREALSVILTLAERLARRGQKLEYIDMGGGIGITYRDEVPMPLETLAKEVRSQLSVWPGLKLLLEPGRFLTADSGVLITRVLYRKRTESTRFVIVDAAMNDLLRPALYEAYHPIVPVRRTRSAAVPVDVVGPVCETSDCFAKARPMPWPSQGDLWAVLKAGAYGFSMASTYNSRPRPPEVLVSGGSYRVIRARETFEDLVRHER
ncbi:MAG: diaminopimelate decarboxylase [Elusimicrobia bacterium]|nr:diaminopimelate decarboxylase [Elusimicrobiota bacterium]